MRTKLFFAFFSVIAIALISNLIFENLIMRDFEDYINGTNEDKLYWVLSSIEGSYRGGEWDDRALHDAVHWAIMLGYEVKVIDNSGREISDSRHVAEMLSPSMRRRMEGIVDIDSGTGDFESYPLYIEGEEIGSLLVRPLSRVGTVKEKEKIFKRRGREFLITSFVIAGSSAVLLAVLFSLFLSRPLKRMKKAVESLAKGDFSVRVKAGSKRDELGGLSESFNFMAEALQREETLRKHLTSNIAHELRTPLAIMKANVEAMIDGVVENREEGFENIRMEVERLIKLVEGIEDITKAEASFFSGRDYTTVDLTRFLSAVAAKMTPLAAGKGLEMKVVSHNAMRVVTDKDKLERIIVNIITNSIKYTRSGGITIDCGLEKQEFFVQIRDSGIGIPEEKIDIVFKRFYRGDESSGIGLGLAIVKELVDVMGGRIEVRSKVGRGSVFTLWFPQKERER